MTESDVLMVFFLLNFAASLTLLRCIYQLEKKRSEHENDLMHINHLFDKMRSQQKIINDSLDNNNLITDSQSVRLTGSDQQEIKVKIYKD